jgi:hypothetical protein
MAAYNAALNGGKTAHHLQGNAAACTAHARVTNDAAFRWRPERKGLLACAATETDCGAL